uniref:Immunoglobulin V-set domain-containing protein n=1 Tax=Biomphalaria glabrata TaxID=6526 RepID=A0A2C9LV49_BIOGL
MSEHFMCFKIFLAGALTTIFVITGLDVRSMLKYPSNNIKGRSAILNCAWTYNANESVSALNIMKNGTVYFSCVDSSPYYPLSCRANNPTLSERFTTTVNSLGDISMNIDNLECSDESTYTCQVVLSQAAGVKQADAFLRIKSVILSAIIIVQFVGIILLVNRRNQGKGSCMNKSVQREPHTYDQP